MSLGKSLKNQREKRNWSQKYVAERVGITNTVLSNYERDYRDPDTETLTKLADLYEVSIDDLLGRIQGTSYKRVVVAGQEITLTAEDDALFNELKKHPVLFHDLASDPEKKIKELIKLYKMKKMFLGEDEDDEDLGDGFGDLED